MVIHRFYGRYKKSDTLEEEERYRRMRDRIANDVKEILKDDRLVVVDGGGGGGGGGILMLGMGTRGRDGADSDGGG